MLGLTTLINSMTIQEMIGLGLVLVSFYFGILAGK